MGSRPLSSFLALHALRLKGFADAASVAQSTGLAEDAAADELARLVEDGLATHRSGSVSGWSATPVGREVHRRLLADQHDSEAAVRAAYDGFLALNGDLLQVCTDWQLRPVNGELTANDHSDPAYDAGVVQRLCAVDDAVQPVLGRLVVTVDRFARYGPRLAAARERVEAGELEWFLRPLADSYHTVWYELHEDFLVSLGIEREAESAGSNR